MTNIGLKHDRKIPINHQRLRNCPESRFLYINRTAFLHESRRIVYKIATTPHRRQHDIRMNIDAYRNEKSLPTTCHELSPEGLI